MNRSIRPVRACAAVAISLFLIGGVGGCFKSKNPLSDLAKAKVDAELIGTWTWVTHGSEGNRWVVTPAEEGFPKGMLRVENTDDGEVNVGYFFTTKLGPDRYVNFVNFRDDKAPDKWDPQRVEDYTLMHYSIAGDVFTSTLLDSRYLDTAIKDKLIAGESDDQQDSRLLADTEELQTFFKKHRAQVLSKHTTTAKKVR